MTEWKIQGSRVYGNGLSINCTNIVTAEQLYNTLNCYETELHQLQQNSTIDTSKIEKQLIQLKLTTNILSDEIDKLQDMIK